LKAKYSPNGMLSDTVFTGNASPTWRAIEYGLVAIEEGLALALHWTRNPITVETDYSNLSSHVRRISVIIERMRETKTRVMKVSREANCGSHGLGAWLNWVEQMVEPQCGCRAFRLRLPRQ
jgi:hypothetical protein